MAKASGEEVLVIGGLRHLGAHVIKQLCREEYKVRAAIVPKYDRSKDFDGIREHIPRAHDSLTLVDVEPSSLTSWASAMRGCRFVHFCHLLLDKHMPKSSEAIIQQMKNMTKVILEGAKKAGVRRVIMTAHHGNVTGSNPSPERGYSETDWANPSDPLLEDYVRMKTAQEQYAWQCMEVLKEEGVFELTVLLPGMVFGPLLTSETPDSASILVDMLSLRKATVPEVQICIVDVRDVAMAHVQAMNKTDAANQRIIIASKSLWLTEISDIIRKEFEKLGYKVTSKKASAKWVKFMSIFKGSYKPLAKSLGKPLTLDTSKMSRMLGTKPRDARKTILESCHNLIDCEYVEATEEYSEEHQSDRNTEDVTPA